MDKTKVVPLPFHSLNAAGSLEPGNIGFCSVDFNRPSCLPSVIISVHTASHLMGETQPKIFFYYYYVFAQHCTAAFFLPGYTVTHPRLCRAHSCPGSVMSLGFSVGCTVCPVCIGGKGGSEDIAFSVREKDKKQTLLRSINTFYWSRAVFFRNRHLLSACILQMGFICLVLVIRFCKLVKKKIHLSHSFPCLRVFV